MGGQEECMKSMVLAILLIVGWAGSVPASGVGDCVSVEVHSDRSGMLPLYPVRSDRAKKAYLAAERGDEYRIVVRNLLGRRVGVVVAVDGRNIISGRKSWLRSHERMYILEPYGVGSFAGWRSDLQTINRFYFTSADDSYAAAFDDRTALGVIAVAVYPEHRTAEEYPSVSRESRKSAGSPAPLAEARDEQAATGYGRGGYDPVRLVDFVPEASAVEKIFLKYAWRETLCRKGIIRCRVWNEGNRFWDDEGFAPPPRRH